MMPLFPHEPRLQTSLDHLRYQVHVCRLKIGITITERCVSSSSPERLKTIQMGILFVFRTSLICYFLPQLHKVTWRKILEQTTFVVDGTSRW